MGWHSARNLSAPESLTISINPVVFVSFRIPLSVPGTFHYHSSVDAQHQVAMGLFGALLVFDPNSPSMDDQVLVINDPLIDPKTWQIHPALSTPQKHAQEQYNGRWGNTILVCPAVDIHCCSQNIVILYNAGSVV